MPESAPEFDYPVQIDKNHTAAESVDHSGDKFTCENTAAYMHTGAWLTWEYCPWCGFQLGGGDE